MTVASAFGELKELQMGDDGNAILLAEINTFLNTI